MPVTQAWRVASARARQAAAVSVGAAAQRLASSHQSMPHSGAVLYSDRFGRLAAAPAFDASVPAASSDRSVSPTHRQMT